MIKGFFQRNLSLKLTALVLAVLLELYFYSPENYVTSEIPVNISVINVPSSLMVVEPRNIEQGVKAMVTVRGPNILVQQIMRANPSFYVSVPEAVRSAFSAALNPEDLRLPLGVDILDIKPSKIDLRFEKIVKKEVKVVPNYRGTPAKGFRLNEVNVFPKKVYVRGPKSELEGVMQVKTSEIDIENADSVKRFEVTLSDLGSLTTYNVNMVSVEADIQAILERKTFKGQEVSVMAPEGYAAKLEPSSVSLVLEGPQSVMQSLEKKEINLFVDGRKFAEGKHLVSISANLPNKVVIVSSEPNDLSLTLVKSQVTPQATQVVVDKND